ncbi:hypothetical protein HJC23_005653 [Cyclotella cryptica]|uniref:Uncharacterized protein n=1 Tax=Cyclotella cryptica TaxID=29204 RepID=A0ABD3PZK4_9STRA|eukprot:CCRYP_010524-RA/>CCRYP_010524-RA protein AED:0.43 eAED:0.43 QI:0/-1/0/1/-1/1/1/0/821
MSTSRPHHRTGTKSTPFSTAAGQRSDSRSHATRSAMTTSIRKAKRGQVLDRKRHMKFVPSSSADAKNPYRRVEEHVKETVEVAESIVQLCRCNESSTWNESTFVALSSSLERLCFLVSPTESDTMGTKIGATSKQPGSMDAGGISYDSSVGGIAGNAILSHFIDRQKVKPPSFQQQQSTDQPMNDNNLAFLLADSLALILDTTTSGTSSSKLQSLQVHAAIALTQLSATEPAPPPVASFDQDQFSPYGHPPREFATALASAPTSWCYVLVNCRALSSLIHKMTIPNNATASVNSCVIDICEKCTWTIGNLAGDSEMAREALSKMGMLPRLISCISWGIASLTSDHCAGPVIQASFMNLLRNSVWALCNFIRDGRGSAADVINVNNSQMKVNGGQENYRLTNESFASLLLLPQSISQGSNLNIDLNNASCHDIATEACWLLAFLTDNDPTAVEFSCKEDSPLMSAILTNLCMATDAASRLYESNLRNDSAMKQQLSDVCLCLIPCCRVLRNISLDGRYLGSIYPQEIFLTFQQKVLAHPTESCLAKLISLATLGAGQEASTIASKAAEAAGACLLHAGFPLPHPSTAACRTLIPALSQALTCQVTTFDVKREVVWALWNAVSNPLEQVDEITANGIQADVDVVQKELLTEVIRTSPLEIAQSLTALLSTMDMDSIEAALRLIEILIQKLGSTSSGQKLTVLFEEAGLVDALWRVCDNDSEESYVAELAASLLDEYFEGEHDESDEVLLGPALSGGCFQFQAPLVTNAPSGGFDFSTNTLGGFAFNNAGSLSHHEVQVPSMGRGRGRGQVIPAWMERTQQHSG